MSSFAAAVVVAVVTSAQAPAPQPATSTTDASSRIEPGATSPDAAAGAPVAADGVVPAIAELMANAKEAARVVVVPVDDRDAARAARLERAIVSALRDRRREEVLTPVAVKRTLQGAATGAIDPAKLGPLAADHVVVGRVVDEGGAAVLRLRLVLVQTGEVLAEASAPVDGVAAETTARAATVRGAIARLVDELAFGVEEAQGDARYQRVAVAPFAAQGEAAAASRLDRFLQAELVDGLRERGFLVVERERLAAAIDQMALGAAVGEDTAPQAGKLVGADVVVVGSVSEAGETFVVSARAVSTTEGRVVAAGGAEILRDNVVVVASDAAETKTAGEALFRSVVAPGWGQAYNGEGAKSLLFAVGGYGAAFATVGLGAASLISWRTYTDYDGTPLPGSTPTESARQLRRQTDALLVATGVAAAVFGAVWSGGVLDAYLVGAALEDGA